MRQPPMGAPGGSAEDGKEWNAHAVVLVATVGACSAQGADGDDLHSTSAAELLSLIDVLEG